MQPLMFYSGIYQNVFVGALIVFALQQLPALRSTFRLSGRRGAPTRDRGSYLVVQILVLSGIVLGYQAALHLGSSTITWHRPLVYFLGVGVIVAGSAISWLAVRQLGRYFTVIVAVRPDQPVVESGMYRVIRHPSYAGQLLVFLGYAVTLTNWVSIPAVMLLVVPGYLYRIRVEEQALAEQLGIDYREYMARTFRLIPQIW